MLEWPYPVLFLFASSFAFSGIFRVFKQMMLSFALLASTLSDVGVTGKSNMTAINRKYICNVVNLSLYYSNKIPTATPKFSGFSNTDGPV